VCGLLQYSGLSKIASHGDPELEKENISRKGKKNERSVTRPKKDNQLS
jgi:hypothetical protein